MQSSSADDGSHDLSKDPAHAALFKNMSDRMTAFKTSVAYSTVNESECGKGAYTPTPAAPTPPTPPTPAPPTPPPTPAFALMADGQCLAAAKNQKHADVSMVACSAKGKWQKWFTNGTKGQIYLAGTDKCLKINAGNCGSGGEVFLSESSRQCESGFTFKDGQIVSNACKKQGMCLTHGTQAVLGSCTAGATTKGWSEK